MSRAHITSIEDVEEIIAPLRENFTVYEKFPLEGSKNSTWTYFNQTTRIPEASVYSTWFLFGHSTGGVDEDEFEEMIDDLEDVFNI